MNYLDQLLLLTSDEFELKFPELIRAELGRLRAELGHLNFRAEISRADFIYINKWQIFTT